MTTKVHELAALGQSIWYDNIRRAVLQSGELKRLVEAGVLGVTSNPTIFEKAIGGSDDYDSALYRLVEQGRTIPEIYEALVIEDIRHAADILAPTYEQTNGVDGYISLEVSPTLAHDTDGTIAEARRLYEAVGRRNVMIKVPATKEGIPAIQTLIGDGININVTLIFALEHYRAVMEAYLSGLERFAAEGGDLSQVASVASFFVSRVDSMVDEMLKAKGNTDLQGKIAIANAKLAYALFREVFNGPRWENLERMGARVQRPLWASTGTKNPAYPDTLYVDALIGPDTVNTVPPATLAALLDHAHPAPTIDADVDEARAQMDRLAGLGISMEAVTDKLLQDGVAAFVKSFESLMNSIASKREAIIEKVQRRSAKLGGYASDVQAAMMRLSQENIIPRLWAKDHTIWKPEPTEITNRLGWLDVAERLGTPENIRAVHALTDEVWADGITHAVLLGMGGSSLAPELFAKVYGAGVGDLDVTVMDTTDPDAVQACLAAYPPQKTLYIVSSKSGGTVEMISLFKFFYNVVLEHYEGDTTKAGSHFIAITDPGSGLADIAQQYQFRKTFLNDPEIGGRYSALSYFGLVPAAIDGVDLPRLLDRTAQMSALCKPSPDPVYNPGAWLGVIMGVMAKAGRDKLTIITSAGIASFGDWAEQLVAESTGKEGRGILPVVGETVGVPAMYGSDRLFVHLRLVEDETYLPALAALEAAGHPVVYFTLNDEYDLGGQFLLWEIATAVASWLLSINPFDQPNVESAKILARQMVAAYIERGALPPQTAALTDGAITAYGDDVTGADAPTAFRAFLSKAGPDGYIALHAYLPPSEATSDLLRAMQTAIREHTKRAVTVGYGPRFLHSTGQLHKGDGGKGIFIQFTNDPAHDTPIPEVAGKPDSKISFGVLKMAQALGDGQALRANNRPVIRFHLGADVMGGLKRLLEGLLQV